jgi:hypothetical protein
VDGVSPDAVLPQDGVSPDAVLPQHLVTMDTLLDRTETLNRALRALIEDVGAEGDTLKPQGLKCVRLVRALVRRQETAKAANQPKRRRGTGKGLTQTEAEAELRRMTLSERARATHCRALSFSPFR